MALDLLTASPKTEKSVAFGYLTAVQYFSPADTSGFEVCFWRTEGCTFVCLNESGRAAICAKGSNTNAILEARKKRTHLYFTDRVAYLAKLRREIRNAVKRADKANLKCCIRLNGTSDIPWEGRFPELFAEFPDVIFYDYTKSIKRVIKSVKPGWPSNYKLCFSVSEKNHSDICNVPTEVPIAFVGTGNIPETFHGRIVASGDEHDLVFAHPQGIALHLTPKGKAKKDTSGFVIRF